MGGTTPGVLRASARTKADARANGVARDAEPHGRPQDVRIRDHRLRRRVGERARKHLRFGARGRQLEARAARAAHAHRVPGRRLRQRAVRLAHEHEDLIARRRVARRGARSRAGRRRARAYEAVVASLSSLKRPPSRRQAQMLERVSPHTPTSEVIDPMSSCRSTISSQVVAEERRRQPVARDARDLDVVHRQHHAARARSPARAPCTWRRAPACSRRDHRARPGRPPKAASRCRSAVDRLVGKSRLGVDVGSVRDGDFLGDGTGQACDFMAGRHGRLL